jgi:hypothetical protein
MVKYRVIIKTGSIFHHHSRRNNMNNLQIDEDIEVELDEDVEILLNNGTFRLGTCHNNNLPIFIKNTKYINTNINEDSLGFTKRLDEEQKVYFNNGTLIEILENTPMHSLCGNLKFVLTSPIIGLVN